MDDEFLGVDHETCPLPEPFGYRSITSASDSMPRLL